MLILERKLGALRGLAWVPDLSGGPRLTIYPFFLLGGFGSILSMAGFWLLLVPDRLFERPGPLGWAVPGVGCGLEIYERTFPDFPQKSLVMISPFGELSGLHLRSDHSTASLARASGSQSIFRLPESISSTGGHLLMPPLVHYFLSTSLIINCCRTKFISDILHIF